MFHVIQLLLKLLLQVEGELPDNSRLVGSVFIGGVWLILTRLRLRPTSRAKLNLQYSASANQRAPICGKTNRSNLLR